MFQFAEKEKGPLIVRETTHIEERKKKHKNESLELPLIKPGYKIPLFFIFFHFILYNKYLYL